MICRSHFNPQFVLPFSAKRTPSVKRLCVVAPRQILGFHAEILGLNAKAAEGAPQD